MPDSLGYLWIWFEELDRTRASDGDDPAALTYVEIDAWARLTGRTPDALEVDALLMLDLAMRHPDAIKGTIDG